MNVKPLLDKVIIKPIPVETKTPWGIIIPDNAKEKPQTGTVLAVGYGKPGEPLTVKVGDTVMYGKQGIIDIVVDDEPYIMMKESDIMAII